MKKLLVSLTAIIALSLLSFNVSGQTNPNLLIFGKDFVCEGEEYVQYTSFDQSNTNAAPEFWTIGIAGSFYISDYNDPLYAIRAYFPSLPEGYTLIQIEIRAYYEGNDYASKTITMGKYPWLSSQNDLSDQKFAGVLFEEDLSQNSSVFEIWK
jgi:hypothetical protein